MASIDKIYGTAEQYDEFYDWLQENNEILIRFLYPRPIADNCPISNFPTWADRWLYSNCPIGWVLDRIDVQYPSWNKEGD